MLQSWTCSGGWCRRWCGCGWVRTTMPITALCDSVTVSDLNPGKQRLNSRPRPYRGGGGVGSHKLPNHVTGNRRSTWYSWRVIRLTRRTATNFLSHMNSSTPYWNIYIVFVIGEDDIARYNSRRYNCSSLRGIVIASDSYRSPIIKSLIFSQLCFLQPSHTQVALAGVSGDTCERRGKTWGEPDWPCKLGGVG